MTKIKFDLTIKHKNRHITVPIGYRWDRKLKLFVPASRH
jgi:hypothetical protein